MKIIEVKVEWIWFELVGLELVGRIRAKWQLEQIMILFDVIINVW